MSTIEQPKGGRWPWRSLIPASVDEALELRAAALDAGYSRTIAAGFLDWILAMQSGEHIQRAPNAVARYRRMLVELSPAEKLEHLTTAA